MPAPTNQRKNNLHKPWTVSVPVALVGRLARRVRSLGMSRSEYLRHLIREDYQKNAAKWSL
jgi:Arc/MetJ-type ribon-helix-helix transcriptional regulator